jgi:hypothetical protein
MISQSNDSVISAASQSSHIKALELWTPLGHSNQTNVTELRIGEEEQTLQLMT